MHKAVIFDLGRVLIDFDFGRGYRALEGVSPYGAREIPRRLAASGLVQRFETGLVEPRDFVAQLSTVLDLHVDYDQFCRLWSSIFTEPLLPESLQIGTLRNRLGGAARFRRPALHRARSSRGLRPVLPPVEFHLHRAAASREPSGRPGGALPSGAAFEHQSNPFRDAAPPSAGAAALPPPGAVL